LRRGFLIPLFFKGAWGWGLFCSKRARTPKIPMAHFCPFFRTTPPPFGCPPFFSFSFCCFLFFFVATGFWLPSKWASHSFCCFFSSGHQVLSLKKRAHVAFFFFFFFCGEAPKGLVMPVFFFLRVLFFPCF